MPRGVSEPASPYDAMSVVYDQVYDKELDGRLSEAALIAALCDRYRPGAASLLDLGAGTGMIMSYLAHITNIETFVGVEQSAGMIEAAQNNAPDAELIQGDIRDFDAGRTFDVVTCLFDTINHLRTGLDWERAFSQANDHLHPGGIFIFDMVTPHFLRQAAKLPSYGWEFEGGKCDFAIKPVAGSDNQYVGNFEISHDGRESTKLEIVETTFDPRHVIMSLGKYLQPVLALDHRKACELDSDSWPRATDESFRIMLVARKPI